MERFQRILEDELYKEIYDQLQQLEEDRTFCCHDMKHFLDVARLCYIFAFEEDVEVSRDVIYAAAFLHDMGRVKQYQEDISHEVAGVEIARNVLPTCGYDEKEIELIIDIINAHRQTKKKQGIIELFYKADKLSRDCITCKARKDCYWPEEQKNHQYTY